MLEAVLTKKPPDAAVIAKAAHLLLTTCRDYIKSGTAEPPPAPPPPIPLADATR